MVGLQRSIAAERLRWEIQYHITYLEQKAHARVRNTLPSIMSPSESGSIWLDCDTGHDDALAILIAARSPEVRLLGISTVYGNAPLEKTTRNTLAVLQAIGRTDVPVYAGASGPLEREACFAPGIHGQTGLDGTTCLPEPDSSAKTDVSAVEGMYRSIIAQPARTAWLVAVGTLTNVALLFQLHPELAGHIAGLSIMGGCVGGGFTDASLGTIQTEHGVEERCGNWSRWAEFNIYCDPEAAYSVFANPVLSRKTTLIPLDLTHQFLATNEAQFGLLFGFDMKMSAEPNMSGVSTVRRLFFEILTFFAKTYAEMFGLTAGPPTHDPLAVAIALRPDLFYCNQEGAPGGSQGERFHVEVVTQGEHGPEVESGKVDSQCGRTIVQVVPFGSEGVRIPRGLDARALWRLLERCLRQTEHSMGQNAQSKHRDPGDGLPSQHAAETGTEDMASLVHGSNVTLSQFEMHTGLMPDIMGPGSDRLGRGGNFLQTNKESKLGLAPLDLRGKGHNEKSEGSGHLR